MRKMLQRLGVATMFVLTLLIPPGTGTLPAAADPPEYDTVGERKQLFVERAVAGGYPHESANDGRAVGGYAAMAQFAMGNVTDGRNFASYHLDLDRDMFWGLNVMEAFMMFGGSYTQTLRDKVKSRIMSFEILNAEGTALSGTTPNHRLMYAAVGVTAYEQWPAEYPDSRYTVARNYLLTSLPNMVKKGHWEYDATTYFNYTIGPLLYLAQYTQDIQIRTMARMSMEWLFAATIGEHLKGSLVATSGRTYNPMQSPGFNTQDTIPLLWMLFGGSRLPTFWDGSEYLSWSFIPMALGNYQLPDIFRRIALDRDEAYTHRERMNMTSTVTVHKTSNVTPDYAVYSQRDDRVSLPVDSGPRWGVKWVTETNADEPSAFFMKHHHPSNHDPESRTYWQGLDQDEEVLQGDGTIIAVYNITDANTWIDGPVSRNGMKATLERSGWIFFHTGNMVLGVKPIKGYSWTTGTEEWFYDDYVRVLRSDGAKNGLIIETAPASDYAGTMAQQLDAFADDISANAAVDATGINNTNPRLSYTNLAGNTMQIVYGTSRTINGVNVNYANWPLLDNPWVHQDYDSTNLTLSHGGETLNYDFTNWTTSGTVLADNFEDNDAVGWKTAGGTWSVVTDGTKMYRQSSLDRTHSSNGNSTWTNYTYEAKIKPLTFGSPTPNPTVGIMARLTDFSNRYGFMWAGGNLLITRAVGGVVTTLASKPFTLATGTTYTFKADLNGDSLEFYVNGVSQLTATDGTFTSGKIAVTTRNATAQFDDIKVTS